MNSEIDRLMDEIDAIPQTPENMPRRAVLARRALALANPDEDLGLWVTFQLSLAGALAESPAGDRARNLEESIAAYEAALRVLDPNLNPQAKEIWLDSTADLATTYLRRIRGDRGENLENAIRLYASVLEATPAHDDPLRWARAEVNLADAYCARIRGDVADNLEQALAAYDAALQLLQDQEQSRQRGRALTGRGIALFKRIKGDRSENLESAIAALQQALPLRPPDVDPVGWGTVMLNLANSYQNRTLGEREENLEYAIQINLQTLSVVTRRNNPGDWAGIQNNLGTIYLDRIRGTRAENIEKAIAYLNRALTVRTRQDMPREWAETTNNLAGAWQVRIRGDRSANLENAIRLGRTVLEVRTKEATPFDWAATMHNLGDAYLNRISGNRAENLEKAIACFRHALEVRKRDSAPFDWARSMTSLATGLSNRLNGARADNLEQAIQTYQQALECLEQREVPREWGMATVNLADAFQNRIYGDQAENLERAIAAYQQALTVFPREQMPADWAHVLTHQGAAYVNRVLGDPGSNLETAIGNYQQALQVRSRKSMPIEWAETQQLLASAWQLRSGAESPEKAIRLYGPLIEYYTGAGLVQDAAVATNNLAIAYSARRRGDPAHNLERAMQLYRQVRKMLSGNASINDWVRATLNLADCWIARRRGRARENRDRAIRLYREALTRASLEAMPQERRAQVNLGNALLARRNWKHAGQAYEDALSASDRLYDAGATPQARQAELREVGGIPERCAYALARAGQTARAVVALERGRARALAEALQLDQANTASLTQEERRQFTGARQRLAALQAEARLPASAPRRDFVSLSEDLREAEAALHNVVAGIRQRVPEFLPEFGLEQIRAGAGTAPLLYLSACTAGGLALLVTAGEAAPQTVWLPRLTDASASERAQQYWRAYQAWLSPNSPPEAFQQWRDVLDQATQWLWEVVMGPLLRAVPELRDVVLIPAGLLGLFPLHAAWKPDRRQPSRRSYALDGLTIRYAPSAAAVLAAQKRAAVTGEDSLLAVVDPWPVDGPPLPNAAPEVAIAVSGFAHSQVLHGGEATRDAVLAAMPQASVLHFSTHGRADLADALSSGLAVAARRFVTVRDFMSLQLPSTRTAILSACETALAGGELPDEVISLPTSLLQVGLARVAATQWPVSDLSTAMLVARFYDLWRGANTPIPEALRQAQRWLRDTSNGEKAAYFDQAASATPAAGALFQQLILADPDVRDHAHPYHWAAFAYFGV